MTGRQLYNYLFTSAPGSYEIYATVPGWSTSIFYVKDIRVADAFVCVTAVQVAAGRQSDRPMTAGRALSALHAALDKTQMDFDVQVKVADRRYWSASSAALRSVNVIPCYRGRALCLVAR